MTKKVSEERRRLLKRVYAQRWREKNREKIAELAKAYRARPEVAERLKEQDKARRLARAAFKRAQKEKNNGTA